MKKYLFGIVFIIYILVGCANTHYQNGRDAFDRGDYDTAIKVFRSLAKKNDPRGQYALAIMYDMGEGVPQSSEEALKYYRLAAEQGYADAQNNLGVMYDQGEGVSKNYNSMGLLYAVTRLGLSCLKNLSVSLATITP